MPKRLYHTLKALREERGLTQDELSKRAGLAQAYIALLESRGRVNPTVATLQRLAKALDVPVSKLLE